MNISSSKSLSSRTPTYSQTQAGGGLSSNTSSALRPRNRRLISTELLGGTAHSDTSNGIYGLREGERDRGLSPIPSGRLPRTGTTTAQGNGKGRGIWEGGWTGSWSTLQNLASSVLGGDVLDEDATTSRPGKGVRNTSSAKAPATWGPSGSLPIPKRDRIAAGSLAERERDVTALKTASVLESHERVEGGLDVTGRFKRRTSTDEAAPEEQDEHVLVYVHPVQPTDTMAGVVLKYNCQPAVFRKSNRLWPNDVMQIRTTVLLPVDACGVRGRPCEAPKDGRGVDLLAPTPNAEEPPSLRRTNGISWDNSGTAEPSPFDSLSQPKPRTEDDSQAWSHVRWVLIDPSPNARPVSISRIPKKDLGYFPPRRRKSFVTVSAASTPRGSFEIPGSTTTPLPPTLPSLSPFGSLRRSSNLSNRPPVTSYFPGTPSDQSSIHVPSTSISSNASSNHSRRPRTRTNSITAADTQRNAWLHGPGGVGTFAKNVRKPGPAQDGFNSWATKHLPGLAIDYLPSKSIAGGETVNWGVNRIDDEYRPTVSGSGTATPTNDGSGSGGDFVAAAAAIEGWVRRLGTRPTPGTPRLSAKGASVAMISAGDGAGDLIELLDGAGSDDGRGFEPAAVQSHAVADAGRPQGGGSGREEAGGLSRRGKNAKTD